MSEHLIRVHKPGEKDLHVHPTALADHKAVGWAVSPDQSASALAAAEDAPTTATPPAAPTLEDTTGAVIVPGILDGLTVPELRAMAEDKKVDLGEATKKADILKLLSAALENEAPEAGE